MELCRRRVLGAGALAGLSLAGSIAGTSKLVAAQPKAGRQVPGIYRIGVGDCEVTAILDGYLDLGIELFANATPESAAKLQKAAFVPVGPTVRGAVNAYVVNTSDKLMVIDAGGRDFLGPTLGQLPLHLTAAGIDPAAVDIVALTHMHPDHVGGLVTENGAAVFPNAELVVHKADWDFWMSPEVAAKTPDSAQPFFDAAQSAGTPYAKRVRLIEADGEIVPEISALALPGHTPGHTGYMIGKKHDRLLIWGDIVHSAVFQFPHPNWSISFDIFPEQAVATRRRIFEMAAKERLMVAGMHLPFPGIGYVVKRNGFRFVPVDWSYQL